MVIVRGGRIACRYCLPWFRVNSLNQLFRRKWGEGAASPAGLTLLVFLLTPTAFADSPRLLTATFRGGCNTYTITVTGEGLKQPSATVSYNIMLSPRSGEPIAIVDSFTVTTDPHGRFHKTIHGSWKKFEFTLRDRYMLSGSAILTSDLTLLHTLTISFSRGNLNCV